MSFLGGLGKMAKGALGGFLAGGPAGAVIGGGLSLLGGHGGGGSSHGGDLGGATQQQGQFAAQDRNRYIQALGGGQEALNTSTQSAVNNAMPAFMQNLQGSREDAIRRGASNGDLATSNEGDLKSAFQRNIASGAGAQAAGMYGQQMAGYGQLAGQSSNNYLSLLSGGADREQANRNAKWDFAGGLLNAAGQAAGAYYGRK